MPIFSTYLLEAPRSDSAMLAPHFGRTGIGIEETGVTWPSDSLFAALVAQAAQLQGGDTFIDAMVSPNPPLRHSSLFPRIGELPLLPRPALQLRFTNPEQRKQIGKGFKKVKFLSPELFRAVCADKDLEQYAPLFLQGGEVWISRKEAENLPAPWRVRSGDNEGCRVGVAARSIWKVESVSHVTVDRASGASAYYEAGRVFFARECGLVLLTTRPDAATRTQFELLLSLLGDSGIGGKRAVGHGAFSFRPGVDMTFPDSQAGDSVVTLSRFLPLPEEIAVVQNQASRYQLVEVGGWSSAPGLAAFRRKEVTMLAEGAVLAGRVRGQVADVRSDTFEPAPQHPIYRSGLALTVPVGAPVKGETHAA